MPKNKIRANDIKSILIFALCYLPAFLYRLFNRNIWLCSERKNEARDNGYWMYKFIRKHHPKQKCFYVIDKNADDRKKIKCFNTLIDWGSLRHYFLFIATRIRISAHVDADTPNARVTNFMDRHHLLNNKRVFLQHGITKDKISFGYFNVSRANLFICGAIPEYEFCKKEFGYPDGNVVLTGFARYDGLQANKTKNKILIMPTWRAWLNNVTENDFIQNQYYQKYNSLLNNKILVEFLNHYDYQVIFLMHPEMEKYGKLFKPSHKKIIVASSNQYDIQTLINESKLLVTDYSSVAFDFAYLKKPIVYYHFDYQKYREYQHPEGYFSYNNDGFGPVFFQENDVVKFLCNAIIKKEGVNNTYARKVDTFFKYFDNSNCLRIYDEIRKI